MSQDDGPRDELEPGEVIEDVILIGITLLVYFKA